MPVRYKIFTANSFRCKNTKNNPYIQDTSGFCMRFYTSLVNQNEKSICTLFIAPKDGNDTATRAVPKRFLS